MNPPEIPGYQVERELGRGGFATVYLAYEIDLHRHVALKVMDPSLTRDAEFSERFQQEAISAAKFEHNNIVRVYRRGVHEHQHYLVCEYVRGGDLSARMREPLTPNEAFGYILQIAGALAEAHAAGMIHRDIKPHNVLLRADGSVAVTDFGIAKLLSHRTMLTEAGAIVGTPTYMSPEQARGDPVCPATDFYALGVILYQMLTGTLPFHAESPIAVLQQHLSEPPPPLQGEMARYQPLIDGLLHKDPDRRIGNVDDLRLCIHEVSDYFAGPADGRFEDPAVIDAPYLSAPQGSGAATRPRGRPAVSEGSATSSSLPGRCRSYWQ